MYKYGTKHKYDYFCNKTKVSFGIGTFCSNDTEAEALNIVIKLQYVNGRPVAKLSDDVGKAMCRDEEYLGYLKRSVEFRLNRERGVRAACPRDAR
jgi:nicotinate phosphoribosyltransferase